MLNENEISKNDCYRLPIVINLYSISIFRLCAQLQIRIRAFYYIYPDHFAISRNMNEQPTGEKTKTYCTMIIMISLSQIFVLM